MKKSLLLAVGIGGLAAPIDRLQADGFRTYTAPMTQFCPTKEASDMLIRRIVMMRSEGRQLTPDAVEAAADREGCIFLREGVELHMLEQHLFGFSNVEIDLPDGGTLNGWVPGDKVHRRPASE